MPRYFGLLSSGFLSGDGAVKSLGEVNEAIGDDRFSDGLPPAAIFAEAAMGADGADEAVGGRSDVFRLLDHEFEGAAGAGGTLAIEAEGAGVAIDEAAIAELEVMRDSGGPLPVEEGFFDGAPFRMPANGAVSFVVSEADGAASGPGRSIRRFSARAAR